MHNTKTKLASDVPTILIEPNTLLRDILSEGLKSEPYRVIAAGSSLESLPSKLDRPPELIVVGGSDLANVTRAIQNCSERYPAGRRVVFGHYRAEHFTSLFQAGAHACIGRDITLETLLRSLDLVMLGADFICQTGVSIASVEKPQNEHIAQTPGDIALGLNRLSHRLSPTEIAILECLVRGDPNKVIARKRQLAEATIKAHIKSILRKIRAANRTQAAIWAMTHLDIRANSYQSPTAGNDIAWTEPLHAA